MRKSPCDPLITQLIWLNLPHAKRAEGANERFLTSSLKEISTQRSILPIFVGKKSDTVLD